jgi:AraC-like DNA-binding protein
LGECMLALLRKDEPDAFEASALAYRIAMLALETALSARGARRDAPESIERVLAHIAAHPGLQIDVTRLAALAGLSRAHFSRQFAAVTGESPAEYLLRENLIFAARLIGADPGLGLKTVAARAGFADPNYFSKAFRRVLGVSPSEFRASGMYEDAARPWTIR